jgi:hypothetical protein
MPAPRYRKLDVRPLIAAGIEPFPKIATALASLGPNEGLTVIAPFVPSPLIERFKSEGWSVRLVRAADGGWQVDFVRD